MNNPLMTPKAPPYLRASTRRWWVNVVSRWQLEEHHIRLLTLAAESWDRCQQARETIAREGLMCPTKAGAPRLHPAARVEADARIAFTRLIRELDLDLSPPVASSRPVALRSNKG
jgi:P27 family predicted phage terminase small subunit